MTWNELADAIRNMTPAERDQPVRFFESYEDDPAIIECEVQRSGTDILGPDTSPGATPGQKKVAIPAGEPYLA